MTAEDNMLEKMEKLNPELYAVVQASVKHKQPQATISRGRKLNPQEQRYSDLWQLEYETRSKYCTEWEKNFLEQTGGFKNDFVRDQLYIMEKSGSELFLSQDSPISLWKILEFISARYGGNSPYGTYRDGMTSNKEVFPATFNRTLFDPKLGSQSGSGKATKLRPEDL